MLGLFGPIPFAAWVGYVYISGNVPSTFDPFLVSGLTLISWTTVAFIFFWEKRLRAHRLYLTIKPGQIETANGEIFYGGFSSKDHLIAYPEKLDECVEAVASRKSHIGDSFVYSREAVHVRIFNEGKPVSELELNAIQDAIERKFLNPVFDLLEDMDSQTTREVGVKA